MFFAKMHFIFLICLFLISMVTSQSSTQYISNTNTDVIASLKYGQSSMGCYYMKSKSTCIAKCNKYTDCVTGLFDQQAFTGDNCFLFKKYFEKNETTYSTSVVLYRRIGELFFLILI